jgi:replication factor C subunit 3/5
MLLVDKYKPKHIDEYILHKDLIKKLQTIALDNSIPHIIIYGPEGCGKRTLVRFFLETIFDTEVNNMTTTKYTVTGSSNLTTEIEIKQSNYHIVIEPNNNNYDKYIVQDIIKEYASRVQFDFFNTSKPFKVVFINNVDQLSYNAQTSLRTTMEKYANNCRFIMVCNSLSKVIEPLISRCCCFRVPSPTRSEIFELVYKISAYENMDFDIDSYKEILDKSNNNIKRALWYLELKKHNCSTELSINSLLDEIRENVFATSDIENITGEKINVAKKLQQIRNQLYNLLITNINLSEIIKLITNNIIDKLITFNINKKIKNQLIYVLIEKAAEYEHRGILGRREIIHLEEFIISIIKNFNDIVSSN